MQYSETTSANGYCQLCAKEHALPMGDAIDACKRLMKHLQIRKSLAFGDMTSVDERLSTDYLFGEARGKMFGVLLARDSSGDTLSLRAFSGQYNGLWDIEGWAPPLFDLDTFHEVHDDSEREIKDMSQHLNSISKDAPQFSNIQARRRFLSRKLMGEIHELYQLNNFRGMTAPLPTIWQASHGIPTGAGDCCGPKLLNLAAKKRLNPIALAEFYWGRENSSGSRQHGCFYPPCEDKCLPILGFMLCGAGTGNHG